MINPSDRRSVYKGLLEREGGGWGGGGCEQTLSELLLHIKPKRKQSAHLPNPKGLPLLAFLRAICVYLLCCKKFHAGTCGSVD